MQWEIGIDMGSAGMRMAQRENGVLFAEHADMAFDAHERQPFAWGDEAHALAGRCPASVQLKRPMLDGVLEDAQAAQLWVQQLSRQADATHRNRRGTVLMSYAPGSRAAHEEALMRAALDAGALEVGLVRSDVAGAIGAGLEVLEPGASFVLEIGAGHISASVWTLGRLAAGGSIPYGLHRIDELLRRALIANHGFSIGGPSVDSVRRLLGAAGGAQLSDGVEMRVPGFDLKNRMARVELLHPSDVTPVIAPMISEIVFLLNGLIAQIPEELAADLIDSGLTVVGGGASLPGLDRVLGEALDIPCFIAEEPENAVVRGLYEILRRSIHFDDLVTDRMARAGRN